MFCISRGLNSSGDTVNRSAFWEICEAHAKLDAETIFSDTLAGFIVIGFLVSKETQCGAASVGEIKTKVWFYQTS